VGPGAETAERQAAAVRALHGEAIAIHAGVAAQVLSQVQGISGVAWWGDPASGRDLARALASRDGAILPLITGAVTEADTVLERHLCIDTTASGGNAELLAASGA